MMLVSQNIYLEVLLETLAVSHHSNIGFLLQRLSISSYHKIVSRKLITEVTIAICIYSKKAKFSHLESLKIKMLNIWLHSTISTSETEQKERINIDTPTFTGAPAMESLTYIQISYNCEQ